MAKHKAKGNPKFKTAVRVLVGSVRYALANLDGDALVKELDELATDLGKLCTEQRKSLTASSELITRYAERAKLPNR